MSGRSFVVGVHVHAQPERLRETLASLGFDQPGSPAVFLLPDGPDEATRDALGTAPFDRIPQLETRDARGVAACFNRLTAASDADVVVLLESGSIVGPGALESLLVALESEGHGLAGPSTNHVWNEQGAFSGTPNRPQSIVAAANEAKRRFGDAIRPLTPLHSLADFCFAVRRDVINAVGAADEAYGLGPCWEMDYNIRAARAGFLGVWVCGAYVHRMPFSDRRSSEEARRFTESRQRYQDKFCGRRLRGEHFPYESHCKGDECPDFAPTDRIRVRLPLTTAPVAAAHSDLSSSEEPLSAALGSPPLAPVLEVVRSARPLVSCIMPTRDRRAWVPQAIRYFFRQDLLESELVILDDGEHSVRDCVPDHPRVRYHRSTQKKTIGAKRNEACKLARGDFIAHWDDDDWYPPTRLRRQVEALGTSGQDVSGSSTLYFYQPVARRAWRYQYRGQAPTILAGASLLYRRRAWERSPFADIQVGEDVRFVRSVGGKLEDLFDPALCIATIHDGNTSPRTPDSLFWSAHPAEEIHELFGSDLPFYEQSGQPLVSCIMPTFNRRAFVQLSLQSFAEQDWVNRELVVVDDGSDSVEDLATATSGVRYLRLSKRTSIGEKRNIACREARGELIAHWDDDDWYSPNRLTWQATPILAGQADLTGLENRFVLRLPDCDFWTTRSALHQRMFVGNMHGGTIVFRRSLLAEGLRYPDANLAEDAALIRDLMQRGRRIRQLENPGVFVYVRHGRNSWQFEVGRFIDPNGWVPVAPPRTITQQTVQAFQKAAQDS